MTATIRTIPGTPYRIVDQNGLRRLLMAGDDTTIHSEMLLGAPDVLLSACARRMLNVLPFPPRLDDIVMIGLGGGQQLRFLHRRLAAARLVGVEIDPHLAAIAREWFRVPPDDARLSVVVGDGAGYVRAHPHGCDVLLCDGATAASLAGAEFYRACHAALRGGGVMALHLDRRSDGWRAERLSMLRQVFAFHIELPVDQSQSVLLLFKDGPAPDCPALRRRARALDALLDLDLEAFVGRLERPG